MFDLDNISVLEFFQLGDDLAERYLRLQEIMNPRPKFGDFEAPEFGTLSFGTVSQVRHNMSKPTYENMVESYKLVFKVSEKQFQRASVVNLFYSLNWIRESIITINEREASALKSELDEDLKAAGVERLNIFKEFSALVSLGEKFGKSPHEIEEWPYNTVFTLLLYDKIYSSVSKAYGKIKSRPKKTS